MDGRIPNQPKRGAEGWAQGVMTQVDFTPGNSRSGEKIFPRCESAVETRMSKRHGCKQKSLCTEGFSTKRACVE
jgi:hypothetical protein